MPQSSQSDRFTDYLKDHRTQVFGYIFAIVRDLEDAEEIYQQTTVVLWQKFDAFDGASFARWACRTAHYVALGHLRSKRRRRICFNEEVLELLADTANTADEAAFSRRDALEDCLNKLSAGDRRLIDLCYAADQPVKTIAERWGRSPQSITNSLRRIRRSLYECVSRVLAGERH